MLEQPERASEREQARERESESEREQASERKLSHQLGLVALAATECHVLRRSERKREKA